MTTNDMPLYEKAIVFDRETKDFAGYINGELVGFWPNYHAAEVALDKLVFDLISGNYFQGDQPQ